MADFLTLIHPAIAIAIVFPLIGIVINFAWQTRQRRLQADRHSKIPANVGKEHVQIGKKLTGAVVGICLLGFAHPTFNEAIKNRAFSQQPGEIIFLLLMFAATIASLIFLYQSQPRLWRVVFALLTSLGILVIGCQDLILQRQQAWIYRRDLEWYYSHFYYGIAVTLLMIISLAIIPEIYRDRSHRWRILHVVLNCLALLLFIGQGMTGTRDLLEIPLSWQKSYVEQLYIQQCQIQPCQVIAKPIKLN
jgi:drug/metabolite transporter (DMT)-like permease